MVSEFIAIQILVRIVYHLASIRRINICSGEARVCRIKGNRK